MNASIVVLYMHQSLIVLNRPLAFDIDSVKKMLTKCTIEESFRPLKFIMLYTVHFS